MCYADATTNDDGTDTETELTLAQFVRGIHDLIVDASHTELPDPNRFDVEVFDGPNGPELINVVARFRNAAGDLRRQHCLLRVIEFSEADWDLDHAAPLN